MPVVTLELVVPRTVWGFRWVFTVCLIRIVPTVIRAIALPHQADAHAILALETELVTSVVELWVLGASGVRRVFIRAVLTVHGAVTHHGTKQALLSVSAHKIHVMRTEGLTVMLIRAVRTVPCSITPLTGWDAGAVWTLEAIAFCLAVGGVLVRSILAVSISITGPPLRDAVAIVTLETGGFTGMIDSGAVGFVGPVPAVVVSIALPRETNAHP